MPPKGGATKGGGTHWADEAAAKIIFEKGGKEMYTCASGITPSGTVHIGNFREIISVELVARALRDTGKNVRFIYSWDDYDVFRKVPKNMPKQDELEKYLRFPITMVPDPWERDESYARHHEVDVEKILPLVGIHPEYLYQAVRYRESRYAQGIRKALEKRDALKEILDKFRDEEHKIQGEWWPVSVFCEKCNKDETEIESWDGDWGLTYRCKACGCQEKLDIRSAKGIKLVWRIDWPMRWEYEKVDFEPAGKEHHSHGGSFDTARLVCWEAYGWDAPVTFRYDFIGIKGSPGKMSSSSGNVITVEDVLKVYTPELVRYLFAGTRTNTEFAISFDLDVIKIYEDYDKTERIAWKIEEAKDEAAYQKEKRIYELSQVSADGKSPRLEDLPTPFQIPFRHLCNLIQIADSDIDRALADLAANGDGPEQEQIPAIRKRAECAKYWVENCAPEEFRFKLLGEGAALARISDVEKNAVRILRDDVINRIEEYSDDKSCSSAIYAAAEKAGVDGKALFTAAYQALIGKDQGPRLASFLRSINKDRLLGILKNY
uniref:Lysine--tRNA ligase n=1 Tax=uncultured bacterium contig00008 TaxID=1181500 RepID=A0A806JZ93_9BACT|nr:lysyl-tRNA synthetase (class I) [uncultured bacterium contig00008]